MAVPMIQQARVGAYVLKQWIKGTERYPLVLMLEPLFRCNLACPGCGKIDYPKYGFLDKQMIRLIMYITKGPTDTNGVYEFTDWKMVEKFTQNISMGR